MLSIERQRGDALFEALVGVVVASIVGLGLAYTASRMMVSQRVSTTQYAVLTQMTNALTTQGVAALCGGTAPNSITVKGTDNANVTTTNTIAMAAPTCNTTTQISVSGPNNFQPATLAAGIATTMNLSTPATNSTAEGLLGGTGVMTISQ